MNARLNILLVSREPRACSHFLNQLGRAGGRTVLACGAEEAARLLLAGTAVDVILIHHESVAGASLISSALKLISPLLPVIVVTAEWPERVVMPTGVDAVCYASSLGWRAACDITRSVRYLLLPEINQPSEELRYEGGRLVPQKPVCLN